MEFRQAEQMNWEEQFKCMKRWYYRIRDSLDNDREDFFVAFFESCHHFKDWLVKDGIATQKEVDNYIDQHDSLKLCADICTFSKHAEVSRRPRTGDSTTQVIGQKLMIMPDHGSSYTISVLKIKSGGKERYDAFQVVKECMDAWAKFLLDKSLQIPSMPQEEIFQNFVKWQPSFLQTKIKPSKDDEEAVRQLITEVNNLEIALYKNPKDEAIQKKFRTLTSSGHGKEADVLGRVQRAIKNKNSVRPESVKHTVEIKNIFITNKSGNLAEVQTLENSAWDWVNGYRFYQTDTPHFYELEKVGSTWKVKHESFFDPKSYDRIVSHYNI